MTVVSKQELKAQEIAMMAITIEEKGMYFYQKVAEIFPDEEIRNIFLRLAEEEKEHQRTFQHIFNLSTGERVFEEDTAKYIHNLLASGVFPSKENMGELIARIKTPKEALAIGIQAEKEAILFYHEIIQNTASPETKDVLSKLLEEEKMHLVEMRESMEEMP